MPNFRITHTKKTIRFRVKTLKERVADFKNKVAKTKTIKEQEKLRPLFKQIHDDAIDADWTEEMIDDFGYRWMFKQMEHFTKEDSNDCDCGAYCDCDIDSDDDIDPEASDSDDDDYDEERFFREKREDRERGERNKRLLMAEFY